MYFVIRMTAISIYTYIHPSYIVHASVALYKEIGTEYQAKCPANKQS